MVGGVGGFAGNVEADGDVRERREVETDGIADDGFASVQDDRGFRTEGKDAVGSGFDGTVFTMKRDVGGSDVNGRRAECV